MNQTKMNFIDTANDKIQSAIEMSVLTALRDIPQLLDEHSDYDCDIDTDQSQYYLNFQMLTQLFIVKYLGYAMQMTERAMTMSDQESEKLRQFANNIKLGATNKK